MPSVKFSKQDFLGKTPMQPGWYVFDVGDFEASSSKDGQSTNFWGRFTVAQDGADQGTEIRHCFNEKALGFAGGAVDFITCFTSDRNQLEGVEVLDVLKMSTGRKVQGYVQWSAEFRRNQIVDWRPVEGGR